MGKVQALVKETAIPEGRKDNDTIRLWEGYREQALLWRAIALLQIPATLISVLLAFLLWTSRVTNVVAPRDIKPGTLSIKEIPDVEFIDHATEFVNLISTYQPSVAKKQFLLAREMAIEPLLANYDNDILNLELRAIETTSRTQLYFIDPNRTKVTKKDNEVIVEFTGDRQKIIAGKEMPNIPTKFYVTLRVIPKNKLNPFGLMISDLKLEDLN